MFGRDFACFERQLRATGVIKRRYATQIILRHAAGLERPD